jgi:peptide/nickel transport system substrate-binding protein
MYDYKKLEPELAERWEVAPDGMSCTFYLRKDARFHDGTPVTAEDVKWSLDRAVSVGGFATFQMKAGSLEKPEQFVVVDKHTFKINFVRRDKLTLPDLAVPVAAIYNSKLAKKHATKKDPWAIEWLKFHTAAGGAYKVSDFEQGVKTEYIRNDDWKCGPLPKIKKVIMRIIPSAATRRALLERGDVDMSFDLPPKDFAELDATGKFKVLGIPIENFMWYVDMQVHMPPFNNPKVREAMAYAIPYERIHKAVTFGRAKKLFGGPSYTAMTTEWPQAYPYYEDLDKAKKLLAEAGYPNGFKEKLQFNLGTATWGEPSSLLIQENLKKIGVNVVIEKIPAANWRSFMHKKNMPLLINNMGGWLNYPDYFFFWNYHGQNGVFNTMSYQNPEMDKYIDGARFAADQEEYERNIKGFLTKAFKDHPRLPLFQANLDVAVQKDVFGYHYWFHRQIDFRQIYKK